MCEQYGQNFYSLWVSKRLVCFWIGLYCVSNIPTDHELIYFTRVKRWDGLYDIQLNWIYCRFIGLAIFLKHFRFMSASFHCNDYAEQWNTLWIITNEIQRVVFWLSVCFVSGQLFSLFYVSSTAQQKVLSLLHLNLPLVMNTIRSFSTPFLWRHCAQFLWNYQKN